MVKDSVWIQQEICRVKLYVYRSNVQNATTIYFLVEINSKDILIIGSLNINLHSILYS